MHSFLYSQVFKKSSQGIKTKQQVLNIDPPK